MKRPISMAFSAAAALVLSATAAHAPAVTLDVGGGLTIPTGDFKTAAKTGWHGLASGASTNFIPITVGVRFGHK